MTSLHKDIAGIVPGVMALGLVGKSASMADKSLKGKAKQGDMIKGSVDILVGVPLIGAVATGVAAL